MKGAHIGDVLNFDLCDLQRVGQIKNLGIRSCILIRCPYYKKLGDDPVIAHCWFSKMAAWGVAAIIEVGLGRNSVEM
jgi:hypothetical protein